MNRIFPLFLVLMTLNPILLLGQEVESPADEKNADILAPRLSPRETIDRLVKGGLIAKPPAERISAEVTIDFLSESYLPPADAILLPPGTSAEFSASWAEGTWEELDSKWANFGLVGGRGLLRQQDLREIYWRAEPEDRLEPAGNNAARWRDNHRDGRPVRLTASLAELVAAGDMTTAGEASILLHGEGEVTMLPGVYFDRAGDGMLMGQNIGIYPSETSPSAPGIVQENAELYEPPKVFFRLNEETRGLRISEHFRLGDLAPWQFPDEEPAYRFVSIDPRLVQFLETYRTALAKIGLPPGKLRILRGFISPTERLRLEQRGVILARYTRYQYGDAVALIYEGKPNKQADLNGDGTANTEDTQLLADAAHLVMGELGTYGGIGIAASYEGPGPAKGQPYLHVDLRGWYVPFEE